MALLAICPELALMNIGVTVGALDAYVAEHRLGVALRAGNVLVHAAEGIAGLVVIKLGKVADWLPRAECVAVLAGHVQIAVRASRGHCRWRLRISARCCKKQQHRRRQIEEHPRPRHNRLS